MRSHDASDFIGSFGVVHRSGRVYGNHRESVAYPVFADRVKDYGEGYSCVSRFHPSPTLCRVGSLLPETRVPTTRYMGCGVRCSALCVGET